MATVTKKQYEGMFLVDTAIASADWGGIIADIEAILKKAEAEIISIRKWDERRLAYDVQKKSRGTYILAYFRCDGTKIQGVEKTVQLSERIMRVLILNADHMTQEDIDKDTPATKAEKSIEQRKAAEQEKIAEQAETKAKAKAEAEAEAKAEVEVEAEAEVATGVVVGEAGPAETTVDAEVPVESEVATQTADSTEPVSEQTEDIAQAKDVAQTEDIAQSKPANEPSESEDVEAAQDASDEPKSVQ